MARGREGSRHEEPLEALPLPLWLVTAVHAMAESLAKRGAFGLTRRQI